VHCTGVSSSRRATWGMQKRSTRGGPRCSRATAAAADGGGRSTQRARSPSPSGSWSPALVAGVPLAEAKAEGWAMGAAAGCEASVHALQRPRLASVATSRSWLRSCSVHG
jgi:hypothetical protein